MDPAGIVKLSFLSDSIESIKYIFVFDIDESDDVTTQYRFKYVLNDAGEIDDLILLKKMDVYTINGEPVDESEWYGWQE